MGRSVVVGFFVVVVVGNALSFRCSTSCVVSMEIGRRTSSAAFLPSLRLGETAFPARARRRQGVLWRATGEEEETDSTFKGKRRWNSSRDVLESLAGDDSSAAGDTKKSHRRGKEGYKRRKAVSRIISSIEESLKEEEMQDAYHNIVNPEQTARNGRLLDVLRGFREAKSVRAELRPEHDLKCLALDQHFSFSIRERIMQIAALHGGLLRSVFLPILFDLVSHPYVPSVRCYIAVLNRLRQESRVTELRLVLTRLAAAACRLQQQQPGAEEDASRSSQEGVLSPAQSTLHIMAFNIYLSTLCDSADASKGSRGGFPRKAISSASTPDSSEHDNNETAGATIRYDGYDFEDEMDDLSFPYLHEALGLLEPGVARAKFCLAEDPNLTSFNTVLHAAAAVGNQTMANQIYQWMQIGGWGQGDIVTFNARLRLAATSAHPRPSKRKQPMNANNYVYGFDTSTNSNTDENKAASVEDEGGDTMAIRLIDDILFSSPSLIPDRYTIDLALVPLARAGRVGDIISLLSDFVRRSNPTSLRGRTDNGDGEDSFSAFLFRLVRANDVDTARVIFDMFLVGGEDDSRINDSTVPVATARHFNVLIEGYRRRADTQQRNRYDYRTAKDDDNDDLRNVLDLFDLMIQKGIKPTAHTLTSMVGALPTSEAVTSVWKRAREEGGVPLSTVVGNALICAYGRVGDAASACHVFDQLGREPPSTSLHGSSLDQQRKRRSSRFAMGRKDPNTWDYLLSAFASGSSTDDRAILNVFSAVAVTMGATTNPQPPSRFLESLHGLTHMEAALWVLNVMKKDVVVTEAHLFPLFRPSSKTYCFVASAVAHSRPSRGELGLQLFRSAMNEGIPADGRFVNAVLRCIGDDCECALKVWKTEIRRAVVACDNARAARSGAKDVGGQRRNLLAAYDGLVFVCGRARRPDVALRVAYAMKKEGLVLSEVLLNCYFAGKRLADQQVTDGLVAAAVGNQYESLLRMECSQFDSVGAGGNTQEPSQPKDAKIRIIF